MITLYMWFIKKLNVKNTEEEDTYPLHKLSIEFLDMLHSKVLAKLTLHFGMHASYYPYNIKL